MMKTMRRISAILLLGVMLTRDMAFVSIVSPCWPRWPWCRGFTFHGVDGSFVGLPDEHGYFSTLLFRCTRQSPRRRREICDSHPSLLQGFICQHSGLVFLVSAGHRPV
ncbi:hypothetical protein PV05_02766 [Exophiala xenobiotica]|uniref:Secreted protein n=1 Tax=Exophiala xenobiotica TaxID=348802 RepID=A0A0D2C0G5_9EURO|nr:uncharacterized protein PV05_02766 [Exophiala xenobiotica]KIW58226.1 hypothetical protein PV05_02766 [Exophiala xenobiotica]